ncbi:hypothetical protein ALC57_00273 [Trachymyrmex cornetzi]|uniref:Uncharacterized protein n=1 Tax=Trachymyrmex cornetzi TaxID=471704 RepID=A0A151JSA7_9HYME|nr:hypothetical protein ALC57_00273 [Trachymyrmex cornetzi]
MYYFGIEKGLTHKLQNGGLNGEILTIKLIINIDGLPLFKSSRTDLWLILGRSDLERVRDAVERHGSVKVNTAFNVLNLMGIEFPMILKDIQKFEQLNDMSINVYNIENKRVLPVRLTSDKKEKHINVLYLQDPRNDGVGHFAWIKNLSGLVSSQLSKHKNKKFFCDR